MSVTTQVLGDGGSLFTVHIYFDQDDVDKGELNDYVILEPKEFGLPEHPTLKLVGAWHSLIWFDLVLKFGGLHPRPIWVFGRDSSDTMDFSRFGGIADRGESPPSDDDGTVLVSTYGFAESGAKGTLVLQFRK